MNFDLTALRTRFLAWYNSLQKGQRRNLWIAVVVFLGAVIALSIMFNNPNYVVVFSNLDAKSAGQITQKLSQSKIPYELQGTSILVPAAQADQVRVDMAMAGLPATGNIDYTSIFSSGNLLGMSSQQLTLEELSVLQQRIAQSIDTINGINNSIVTIVPQQQQSFLLNTSAGAAKATVALSLAPSVLLSPQQVFGIQELVANSVQGLTAANVAVVDQNGNDLSANGGNSATTGGTSAVNQDLAMQQQLEQSIQSQLQASLSQMVGSGNVQVIVHAAVTFNQVTQQKHQVTTGPILSTQTSQTSSTGATSGTAAGIAGQATQNPNITTYGTTGTGNGGSSASKSGTTNYDNNYTNTSTTYDPMQINGYSVSVLINSKVMPLTNQLKTAIQSYVTNAVGQRGTTPIPASVSIAAVPFTNQVVVPPAPSFFSTPTGIASIAGGALLLIVLFLLWRRSRNRQKMTDDALGSLTAASSANAPSEAEEVSLTKQLQEMALRRPEAFAGLLRSWISED